MLHRPKMVRYAIKVNNYLRWKKETSVQTDLRGFPVFSKAINVKTSEFFELPQIIIELLNVCFVMCVMRQTIAIQKLFVHLGALYICWSKN